MNTGKEKLGQQAEAQNTNEKPKGDKSVSEQLTAFAAAVALSTLMVLTGEPPRAEAAEITNPSKVEEEYPARELTKEEIEIARKIAAKRGIDFDKLWAEGKRLGVPYKGKKIALYTIATFQASVEMAAIEREIEASKQRTAASEQRTAIKKAQNDAYEKELAERMSKGINDLADYVDIQTGSIR